jgi:multidrug resistance protein, MATE family
MLPLGISSAAAVRVGNELGRGNAPAAARSGWTALSLAVGVMSFAALTLLSLPGLIARLFTPQAEVIATAIVLLRIAAFFQLFDGLQVVATGALRGSGDTRTPMLCHFAGYWMIGLPVGAGLCFRAGFGVAGLWAGLSLGLILIGSALAWVWRRAARGFVREVDAGIKQQMTERLNEIYRQNNAEDTHLAGRMKAKFRQAVKDRW